MVTSSPLSTHSYATDDLASDAFDTFDAVVVGGGFYGARFALMLRARGQRVLLVERGSQLLGRASLRNQARVHNGYHYPRSILTSLRSRMNYARFLDEYADCVDRSFPHYYAVGRGMSKITAAQFVQFCQRIGAPVMQAPPAVAGLFDRSRVDGVFEVQECAFDAVKLRARVVAELAARGVDVRVDTEAVRVSTTNGETRVALRSTAQPGDAAARLTSVTAVTTTITTIATKLVLNCTYSRLNRLLVDSGAAPIAAKHELTEMALVEPPAELRGAAVTVMDGPFFSLMPYPSRGLFTFSHVRYTPHCNWHDRADEPVRDGERVLERLENRETRFGHMVRDARRFLPAMRGARYVDSIFEVKTVMPRSEQDDSRPIVLRRSDEHPALLTVLGAKIDSVYDVEDALNAQLEHLEQRASQRGDYPASAANTASVLP
jgi:glycine/D-amino acid oxidase-like deaminating enzyme